MRIFCRVPLRTRVGQNPYSPGMPTMVIDRQATHLPNVKPSRNCKCFSRNTAVQISLTIVLALPLGQWHRQLGGMLSLVENTRSISVSPCALQAATQILQHIAIRSAAREGLLHRNRVCRKQSEGMHAELARLLLIIKDPTLPMQPTAGASAESK